MQETETADILFAKFMGFDHQQKYQEVLCVYYLKKEVEISPTNFEIMCYIYIYMYTYYTYYTVYI